MAAYLNAYDLAEFNPKAPPTKTPAFWEMVAAHRAPESNELASVVDLLGHPHAVTRDMLIDQAYRAEMFSFEHWLADRHSLKKLPHRLEELGYTVVMNPDNKDGQWKIGGRNRMVYAKADLSESKRLEAAGKVPPVTERPLKSRSD